MSGPTPTPPARAAVRTAPGQAPLSAENAAALLRRNAADPSIATRPAVRFEDRVWTHGEYVAESCRWANLFLDRLPDGPARRTSRCCSTTCRSTSSRSVAPRSPVRRSSG